MGLPTEMAFASSTVAAGFSTDAGTVFLTVMTFGLTIVATVGSTAGFSTAATVSFSAAATAAGFSAGLACAFSVTTAGASGATAIGVSGRFAAPTTGFPSTETANGLSTTAAIGFSTIVTDFSADMPGIMRAIRFSPENCEPLDIAASKRRTASGNGSARCRSCPCRNSSGNVSGTRPDASGMANVGEIAHPRSNVTASNIRSPPSGRQNPPVRPLHELPALLPPRRARRTDAHRSSCDS